jgi:hypothetical protein
MAAAIQLNYRRPAAVAISLVHVCNHGRRMNLQKLGNNVLQSAGTCGPFPPVLRDIVSISQVAVSG